MQFKGWKLVGAGLLAGTSAATFAAPLVLYDGLSVQSVGYYINVTTKQHVGYRISQSIGDVEVNQLTLLLRLGLDTSGWPSVEVCSDGAGGTSPNLSDCSPFTPLNPVTNSTGPVRFAGSKTFSAGQGIWVVAKALSLGIYYPWANGDTPGSGFASVDSGATWHSVPVDFGLLVEADPVVPPPPPPAMPASIPTVTDVGLVLMSALLAASAWVFGFRRKD